MLGKLHNAKVPLSWNTLVATAIVEHEGLGALRLVAQTFAAGGENHGHAIPGAALNKHVANGARRLINPLSINHRVTAIGGGEPTGLQNSQLELSFGGLFDGQHLTRSGGGFHQREPAQADTQRQRQPGQRPEQSSRSDAASHQCRHLAVPVEPGQSKQNAQEQPNGRQDVEKLDGGQSQHHEYCFTRQPVGCCIPQHLSKLVGQQDEQQY